MRLAPSFDQEDYSFGAQDQITHQVSAGDGVE
jgi:hypothetical protein